MAPPRTYRAEALTLKKMPLGEADLLLTLYTREEGKLRAVAKGARRSTSRLVGHFEPLTLSRLSLVRTRNLDIATQAQVIENFTELKGNLTGITKGLYVAELVEGFGAEAHPNQPLYDLALETLQAVGQSPNSDLPLRFFELHLLEVSGFMPELYRCLECLKPLVPSQHRYTASGGGTLCLDCRPTDTTLRPLSVGAVKVLRLLHRSRLKELPPLSMNQSLERELKSILTTTVQYWIDREIRSNSFLEHLQRSPPSEVYS